MNAHNLVGLSSLDDFHSSLSLLLQLLRRELHKLLGVLRDREIIHNGPLTILAGDGEGIDQALRNTVLIAIRADGHRDVLALSSTEDPIMHVIASSVGSREGGRSTTGLNDSLTSELNGLEVLLIPVGVVLEDLTDGLAVNSGVEDIGILSIRVVTPDDGVLDLRAGESSADGVGELSGNEGAGTVVVETSHSGEVLSGNRRAVLHADKGVGVGGVGDNEDLDVSVGNSLDGLALGGEDVGVLGNEILANHALQSGETSDEEGVLDTLEGDHGIVGSDDAYK